MKIVRCGITYELTYQEMQEVYRIVHKEYLKEDIESYADANDIRLSIEDINEIAERADNSLNKNDSYWEDYWIEIENSIYKYKEVN